MGFLHEPSGHQTKQSLVHDLQEPFRWIADVTVMDAFESKVLDLPDFYFTGDDYRYRFEPEPKQRFLDLLRERFNSGVRYKGRAFKWDTVIEQKTGSLAVILSVELVDSISRNPSPTYTGRTTRIFGDEYSVSRSRRLGGLESEKAHSTTSEGTPRKPSSPSPAKSVEGSESLRNGLRP